MLIDDNADDNFFHERVILKSGLVGSVVVKQTAIDALTHLSSKSLHEGNHSHPDLIFLDINMPAMNGWEFLAEYNKLDDSYKSEVIIIMLTSSDNPMDERNAKSPGKALDFKIKPLTSEMLRDIIDLYF